MQESPVERLDEKYMRESSLAGSSDLQELNPGLDESIEWKKVLISLFFLFLFRIHALFVQHLEINELNGWSYDRVTDIHLYFYDVRINSYNGVN